MSARGPSLYPTPSGSCRNDAHERQRGERAGVDESPRECSAVGPLGGAAASNIPANRRVVRVGDTGEGTVRRGGGNQAPVVSCVRSEHDDLRAPSLSRCANA
jgi:hypothetical protein